MSITRFVPSLRGWTALVFAAVASASYPMLVSPYRVESNGVGSMVAEVPVGTWILGGLLVFVSFAACVEAFRRGSRADKVAAVLGAGFSVVLLLGYLLPLTLPVRPG